ncbi:hypothetical protein, partial [Gemmiger sp.]|uniref:hypothetical protein n=1 Tax=Gemmiger sp. TaxID=2049027 RepID=UPI003AF7620E
FVIDFCLRLLFRATLRRFTRFNGMLPLCVPFGDPKGTEKVPATFLGRLPDCPLRGLIPLQFFCYYKIG